MEVWQGETFNLDFLSEFEFCKTSEDTAANNLAVLTNSSFPSHQANLQLNIQHQPPSSLIPTSQGSVLTTYYDKDKQGVDQIVPSEYPKDEEQIPWQTFVEELNEYNWQQDNDNRVKLLLSNLQSEDVDMKPICNKNDENTSSSLLQIKQEDISTENISEWPTNEITLQLKMESNVIQSESNFVETSNYHSVNKDEESFLIDQKFKKENLCIDKENSIIDMRVTLDDTVVSQNKDLSVPTNSNVNYEESQEWQENWEQDDINLQSLGDVSSESQQDTTTNADVMLIDQIKEWEKTWQETIDPNNLAQTEEWISQQTDVNNVISQIDPWQQSDSCNIDTLDFMEGVESTDMEFILSQIQGEQLNTGSLNNIQGGEEGREHRLPDWNTAFGHTRPTSLGDEFSPQVCEMYFGEDGQQPQHQIEPQTDLQAAPAVVTTQATSQEMITNIVTPLPASQNDPTSTINLPTESNNTSRTITTENIIPDTLLDTISIEPSKKCKPKKAPESCFYCGKCIVHLSRHMVRVHNIKKVNGEFVPFNVHIPAPQNDSLNIDTQIHNNNLKENDQNSPVNVKFYIENTNITNTTKDTQPKINNIKTFNFPVLDEICICALCNKEYKSKASITKHLQAVHKFTDKLLKCKHCSFTTIHSYNLKEHNVTRHSPVPSYVCYFCAIKYKSRSSLRQHIDKKHAEHMESQFGGRSREHYITVMKLCRNEELEIIKSGSPSPKLYTKIVPNVSTNTVKVHRVKKTKNIPVFCNKVKTLSLSTKVPSVPEPIPTISTFDIKRNTLTLPITRGDTVLTLSQSNLILSPTIITNSVPSSNIYALKEIKQVQPIKSTHKLDILTSSSEALSPVSELAPFLTFNAPPSTPNQAININNDVTIEPVLKANTSKVNKVKNQIEKVTVTQYNVPIIKEKFTKHVKSCTKKNSSSIPIIKRRKSCPEQKCNSEQVFMLPEPRPLPSVTSNTWSAHCNSKAINVNFPSKSVASCTIVKPSNVIPELTEADSTSQALNLSLPSTSTETKPMCKPVSKLPATTSKTQDVFLSPFSSNSADPNLLKDGSSSPLDYSKKHIEPLSPLSPSSSCLSPSPSIVPPSETSTSYSSISNSEHDGTEVDSQQSQSFSSNEPISSNQNSDTSNSQTQNLASNNNNNNNNKRKLVPVEQKCLYCHKTFYSKHNLNNHIRNIHENTEKKYPCPLCTSYIGSNQVYLKRHMKTHVKIVCNICNKKFIDQTSLEKHELSDHLVEVDEEKNIEEYNNETIIEVNKQHNELNAQMFENFIDGKDNKCYLCDVTYNDRFDMNTHIYKYHYHSNYINSQCLFCSKVLKLKQYLRKHLKNVHKINFETK